MKITFLFFIHYLGLGDQCSDNAMCNTNIPHSECKTVGSSSTCVCVTGYKASSGSCVAYGKHIIYDGSVIRSSCFLL